MTQVQCHLKFPREPLQIPYPKNYQGTKSGDPEDEEFFISTEPRWLTPDEILIAEAFMQGKTELTPDKQQQLAAIAPGVKYRLPLPYRQEIAKTGAILVGNDSLLNVSHDQIDEIEQRESLPNTRYAPGGGERSTRERVYIIREHGYQGNGTKALSAATS